MSDKENMVSESKPDNLIGWWEKEQRKSENRKRQLAEAQERIDKLAEAAEKPIISDYLRSEEHQIPQGNYETLAEWWNNKKPEERDLYEKSIRDELYANNIRGGESRFSHGPYQTIAEWSSRIPAKDRLAYEKSIKEMHSAHRTSGNHQNIIIWILFFLFCIFIVYVIFSSPSF